MIKNRLSSLLAVAALSGAAVFLASGSSSSQWDGKAEEIAAVTRTRSVLSEVYTIDQKYRSMMGPSSSQGVRLLDVEPLTTHVCRDVKSFRIAAARLSERSDTG